MKLEMYTVESKHLETGRITESNRLAVSEEDAFRLERREFGSPIFKVLRAWKKIEGLELKK